MEPRTAPYEAPPDDRPARTVGSRPADAPPEVSLLDGLVVVARRRRLVLLTAALLTVLGAVYALLQPDEYTSSATLVREAQEGFAPGGAISALRSFGFDLGAAESGLSVEAYPDILATREVRLTLLSDTFYIPSEGTTVPLMTYVLRPSPIGYVVNAPRRWLKALRDTEGSGGATDQLVLSEMEQAALGRLGRFTGVSADEESGLMTLAMTTRDPYLSAELVERSVALLRERVRAIRTQKARENLAFVSERFAQAEEDLRRAQGRLAAFDDRNRAIQTASLRAQRERLQQDAAFKREYYNELRTEVTRAELDLQRSEPVITVVEEPVVVLRPSNPNRVLIVLTALVAGVVLGVVLALLAETTAGGRPEDRAKWAEVRRSFALPWRRTAAISEA